MYSPQDEITTACKAHRYLPGRNHKNSNRICTHKKKSISSITDLASPPPLPPGHNIIYVFNLNHVPPPPSPLPLHHEKNKQTEKNVLAIQYHDVCPPPKKRKKEKKLLLGSKIAVCVINNESE